MKVVNFVKKWREFMNFRAKFMNFRLKNKEKRVKRFKGLKKYITNKKLTREREREREREIPAPNLCLQNPLNSPKCTKAF